MTNWPALLMAIATVESGGRDGAHNVREGAIGRYQVRRLALEDVCSLTGAWVPLSACRDARVGAWVVYHYALRWGCRTPEEVARVWNGGPRGMRKAATLPYWRRVRAAMETHEQ